MSPEFDLKKLTIPTKHEIVVRIQQPRHEIHTRIRGKFLKGPISLGWLSAAAILPGKTLHVGIALWFLAGLSRSATVALSGRVLRLLGVHRHSGYRGLIHLEQSGLVSVVRHSGRNPIITLLPISSESEPTPFSDKSSIQR